MPVERWFLAFRLRLRSLLQRPNVEAELDEELRLHVEHLTEINIAEGTNPEEARRQALKAMEGYEQKKEECRDWRGVNGLENFARDVRYALRMLRRSPVFTAVAVLSLALGIGANTAIFSAIDTLLLRPLPVPRVQELRNIFLQMPERLQPVLSYPIFQALQAHNRVFSSVAAWSNHRFQMASGGDVVHVDGELASGSYFSTLALPAARGRTFTDADDHPSGGKDGPVAVISDRFWDRHFQRSASAVGSGLVLDRIRFTVIGVMPPDFFGAEVGTHPDVWIPISFANRVDDSNCIASRACWWLFLIGRMNPGVTPQQVNAELSTIGPAVLRETTPPGWRADWKNRYRAYTFSSESGAQGWSFLRLKFTNPLMILMMLVGLVLLIACANMANLLLARASARRREIAVRLSMGAGRARIIRQLLTESVLLSLAGGVLGVLFAFWLTRILVAFVSATQERHGPGRFWHLELHPDWRIVLFTFGVALLSGILFGLTPALRSTRMDVSSSLKEAAHQLRSARTHFQSGRLLLTFQTALSVLLVAAAGLFAGSLFHLLTQNYGFNPQDVQLIEIDTDKQLDKGPALTALYSRILERANELPGVKAASLLRIIPLSGGGRDDNLHVPGKPELPDRESDTLINSIGPRFFDVMQINLLSGRQFDERDTMAAEKVGIISRLAAHRFFPGENPIGQHVLLDGKPIRIIGVADNIKYFSLRSQDSPELYLPYTQKPDRVPSYTFILKMRPGVSSPNQEFRAMLHEMAPDVPLGMTYTMQQQVDSSVGLERLMASLSVFFGTLALLLTAIGLYGILAYTVARRTGEIGIRMALGARRGHVIWLVVRGAMSYVLAGIVIGAVVALAASHVVASLLYGVRPNDPGNLVAAVFVLLFVAALAALFPSLRASRVDPAVSLRQE
jgi:predicted permease